MDLAGHELPSGSVRLEPYQNWLLHDTLYAEPRSEPHPVAAFVLARPLSDNGTVVGVKQVRRAVLTPLGGC